MTISVEEALIKSGVPEYKAKQAAELVSSYEKATDVLNSHAALTVFRQELVLLQCLVGFSIGCTLILIGVVCAFTGYWLLD